MAQKERRDFYNILGKFSSLIFCLISTGCASYNIADYYHNTDPSHLSNKEKLIDLNNALPLSYSYLRYGNHKDYWYTYKFITKDIKAIRKQLPKGEFLYFYLVTDSSNYCGRPYNGVFNSNGTSPFTDFLSYEYNRYKDLRNYFIIKNKTGYSYRCIRGGGGTKDKKLAIKYANELIKSGNKIGCVYYNLFPWHEMDQYTQDRTIYGGHMFSLSSYAGSYEVGPDNKFKFFVNKKIVDECNALGYHSLYNRYKNTKYVTVKYGEYSNEENKIRSIYIKKDIRIINRHENVIPRRISNSFIENVCNIYPSWSSGKQINISENPIKFKEDLNKEFPFDKIIIREDLKSECSEVFNNGFLGPRTTPILFYKLNSYIRNLRRQSY